SSPGRPSAPSWPRRSGPWSAARETRTRGARRPAARTRPSGKTSTTSREKPARVLTHDSSGLDYPCQIGQKGPIISFTHSRFRGHAMTHVDEPRLESDLGYRFEYVAKFVGFGPDDVAVIHGAAPLLAPLVPALVDAVYVKLFEQDATWRHFVPRQSGYTGE